VTDKIDTPETMKELMTALDKQWPDEELITETIVVLSRYGRLLAVVAAMEVIQDLVDNI